MRRRRLVKAGLAGLLLVAAALAAWVRAAPPVRRLPPGFPQTGSPGAQGSPRPSPAIVSRVAPQEGYVEVLDVSKWQTAAKNWSACQEAPDRRDRSKCPDFEWRISVVPEEFSRRSAREVQRAWKRFQERAWWRANVAVNNLVAYPIECWVGVWQGNRFENLALPEPAITVRQADLPSNTELPSGLSFQEPDPHLSLEASDWWASGVPPYVRPAVPKEDFCDGLSWQPLPYPAGLGYIPNWQLYLFGVLIFQLAPNWPLPANWSSPGPGLDGATRQALAEALGHAWTRYYGEYWSDVSRHGLVWVAPALAWEGLSPTQDRGAVLQPVVKVTPEDLQRYPQDLRTRWAVIEKASRADPRAALYYGQPNTSFPTLSVAGIGEGGFQPPGIERLEQFKRWFPAGLPNALAYEVEKGGYATFYELWNQRDVVYDRPVFYYATALVTYCDLWGCSTWPVPVVIPRGWVVHTLQRVHYGWFTVPEGYGIPRAQGEVRSLPVNP